MLTTCSRTWWIIASISLLGLASFPEDEKNVERRLLDFRAAISECRGVANVFLDSHGGLSADVTFLEKGPLADAALAKVFNSGIPIHHFRIKARVPGKETAQALRQHRETLKEVELSEIDISTELAQALSQCRHLDKLTIVGGSITPDGLEEFRRLTELRLLMLSYLDLDNESFKSLSALRNLQELSLSYSKLPKDCSFIRSLTALQTVDLRSVSTADSLGESLASLPSLSNLTLSGTTLSRATLEHLSTCRLRDVNLSQVTIDQDGAKAIRRFSALRSLSLRQATLRAGAFLAICQCPELETLDIASASVELSELPAVKQLRRLASFDASNLQLTESFVSSLVQCQGLERLTLANTGLTDKMIAELRSLIHIVDLDVSSCALSDVSLQTCEGFRRLRLLCVSDTKVTADGVKRFKKDRPWVELQE